MPQTYRGFMNNAARITRLSLDPDFPDAVAKAVAVTALHQLRKQTEAAAPAEDWSRFGLDAHSGVAFAAQARVAIEQTLQGDEPVDLLPVAAKLDAKFLAWQQRSMANPLPAWTDGAGKQGNPFLRGRLLNRRKEAVAGALAECSASQDAKCTEATAPLQDFRRVAERAGKEWASFHGAIAGDSDSSPLRWAALKAAGAGSGAAAAIWTAGLSTALTGATGAGIAALTLGAEWLRRKRTPSEDSPQMRVWRELVRPAADLLIRYYDAAEHAWLAGRQLSAIFEADKAFRSEVDVTDRAALLEQALEAGDDDLFREVHATRILLGGLQAARLWVSALPESERDALVRNALAAIGSASGKTLADLIEETDTAGVTALIVASVREHVTPADLNGVVQSLQATGLGAELERRLRGLDELSGAVLREKHGIRIDRTLCPRVRSVGLPLGTGDPLLALIAAQFPGAAVFTSFEPNAIEILFDVHNLPLEYLLVHELAEPAYTRSSSFERRLWHMPRKLRAGAGHAVWDIGNSA